MGGGSGDAAAALRLAAHAAGVHDRELLLRLAGPLGGDVPSQVEPGRTLMTGAGERVRALPGRESLPMVILPSAHALSTPAVYRAFDELGVSRGEDELARLEADPDELPVHNDLQDAARRLCPYDRRRARRAPSHGRPARAGLRLGTDRVRPLRRPRRRERGRPRGRRNRRRARRRRVRGGPPGVKWGWLLAAVALAGYLVVRRHKLGRPMLAAGAVGVVAAVLVGTGVVELPNIEKLIEDAGTALGRWTYLLVGVLAFLETGAFIGLVAPGETAVLVGGLVAGQGQISLFVLIAIVWTCAVAGDLTSYTLGRRLGRAWLLRHGERLKITESRLHQVERFFERAGGVTILVGRFIGLVRALAPFIAGTSRMPLRVFLPYDIVGAGAWAATFCVLGYIFWQSFDKITQYVSRGLFAFGTVVAIGVALYLLVRLRRDTEFRAKFKAWLYEREDKPLMRPLLRLGIPVWRNVLRPAAAIIDNGAMFVRDRLTPGHFGLELTTLLALLAVGSFSFFLLAEVVTEPGEPRIDTFAENVADDMRFEGLELPRCGC